MKVVKSTLLLAALTSTLVSCSKDDENNTATSLEGEYAMISLKADTYASSVSKMPGSDEVDSSIVTSSYESTKTEGTVTIDPKNFVSKKLGYTVSGRATGLIYVDGELMGESNQPFDFTIPASDGSSPYKLVGTDSIYFSGGFISSPVYGQEPVPSMASGVKYKWAGDTLILTTAVRVKDTDTQDGVTAVTDTRINSVIRMKKK